MIIIKIPDEYNEFGTEQANLILYTLSELGFEDVELEVQDAK